MAHVSLWRHGLLLASITGLAAATASAQWQIVTPAPTTADLRGIDNVGNGVAWASGTDGTVLRTEDAGYLWQRCTIPPGADHLDFRGIQAFDANTAIVMSSGKGPLSRLYKTTDGCQTWTILFTNPYPDSWDDLALAPPRIKKKGLPRKSFGPLYILGDPVKKHFIVWVMKKPLKPGPQPRRIHQLPPAKAGESASAASNSILYPVWYPPLVFFPAGLGIAVNSPQGAHWLQFTDSMSDSSPTWHTNPVLNGAGCPSFVVSSVAFRDWERVGVAVGGEFAKPDDTTDNVAYTDNGGRDWNSCLSDYPPHGYRSAVAYDGKSKTWITVGPNGTDVSTDDGQNWRALRPDLKLGDAPDADQHWNALSLPYVVGPHGRIGILRRSAIEPAKAGR